MNRTLNNTLASLSGTDFSKLIIPSTSYLKTMQMSNDIATNLQQQMAEALKAVRAQQIAISGISSQFSDLAKTIRPQPTALTGLSTQLAEFSKVIKEKYSLPIQGFETIVPSLQSSILKSTATLRTLKPYGPISTQILENMRIASTFNVYQRYSSVYSRYGGPIEPESISNINIEDLIHENRDLLHEINAVIQNAEVDGTVPQEVPNIVFDFLKRVFPGLSMKVYSFLVLVFFTTIYTFQFQLSISTQNSIDDEVIPRIESLDEKSDQAIEIVKDNQEQITDLKEKQDSMNERMKSISDQNIESHKEIEEKLYQTNNKLDTLIELFDHQKKDTKN